MDRNGNPIDDYPNIYNESKLLGINALGLAEYYDESEDSVFFAILSSNRELIVPPPEYGFAHDLPLEEYEWTLREYLELVPDERGEWKSMSDFANEILE